MKKIWMVVLICLLLVPVLASCSKSSTEVENTVTQTPSGSISPILTNMGTIEIDIEDAPPLVPADHIFVTMSNMEIHQVVGAWISVPVPNVPFDLKV